VAMDGENLRSGKFRGVNRTLVGILGLLVITIVSTVPLTLTILQLRQSDGLVIDMAGRQRMLLERHMKELLLAADGVDTPYQRTREVLRERVDALMRGGSTAVRIFNVTRTVLPSAPNDEIRGKLLQQKRLLEALVVKADRFLQTPRTADEYRVLRDDLLEENAALLEVANDAVVSLASHSEERVSRLVRWELIVVLLVVSVASVGTWRFVQAENEVKRSQIMTMEAFRQRDAVKSSLLSSVSHELRTPLTAIKTMLYDLHSHRGEKSGPAEKDLFKNIDEELDYLNHLVGNMLDMSRIEAGTLSPNREWHVLEELVEGAIRRVGQRLDRRELQIDLSSDLPPIYVDGVEIQQVLVNLLDNAVKFSPEGTPIHLGASRTGEAVEVRVTNQGEGIPSGELERIFDRFYRVSPGHVPATPGTGLGLAICKGIVEAHGGQIEARSISGRETTLSFRVPFVNAPSVHEKQMARAL
jgi:two-component system, OmpR family, sensor histidine kinase KdpD